MKIGKVTCVVVNGYPLSGKDTFVGYCRDALLLNCITHNISSVDRVKQAASLLGWNGEKDVIDRNFLSNLKDLSTFAYDAPYKYMLSCIEERLQPEDNHVFFFHIREPEEIKKFVSKIPYKTTSVFLVNQNAATHFVNTGDSQVTNYPYKHYISNNGSLLDLMHEAKKFCDLITED